jgi:hypothetical protein
MEINVHFAGAALAVDRDSLPCRMEGRGPGNAKPR